MLRIITLPLALAFALVFTAPVFVRAADPKDDEAKAIAVKVTTAGATLFDAKDAAALAATFTEEARLEVTFKGKDDATSKNEIKQGRSRIEAYYRELFKGDAAFHAKNTVEYARAIGPDMILFAGTFVPDAQAAEPWKIAFVQVRSKHGEDWKVVNMQVFVILDK